MQKIILFVYVLGIFYNINILSLSGSSAMSVQEQNSIEEKYERYQRIIHELKNVSNFETKTRILRQYLPKKTIEPLSFLWPSLSFKQQYALLSAVILDQHHFLLERIQQTSDISKVLEVFFADLLTTDKFYQDIGGIIGYHYKVLQLLKDKNNGIFKKNFFAYHQPPLYDISSNTVSIKQHILSAIKHLPQLCEIYVVGGAADRLHIFDYKTNEKLPAAHVVFAGKSFLATLIQDVQAKEFLYYKLFDKNITVPICMMTSSENNNHQKILQLLHQNNWFFRDEASFQLFMQPLVPVITNEGNWLFDQNCNLVKKPGGHGVVWKLACEQGVLDWLQKRGKKKALIRQINNPIAGTDYSLLAFLGIGFSQNMRFGFASCPRACKAAEGMNILIEKKPNEFVLTNIEYCDFQKYGIEDVAQKHDSEYSQFPSNTNILFADLNAIQNAVISNPLPGMLVNIKPIFFKDNEGNMLMQNAGRLETLMQNIADSFWEKNSVTKTYITYNDRKKTISAIKRVYDAKNTPHDTPEKCFYDFLNNQSDLLKHLRISHDDLPSFDTFIQQGPSWVFFFHPALGPLHSIIAQKIRGGSILPGSELCLNITELDIENISLNGSLIVDAQEPMGHRNKEGVAIYSDRNGKCVLHNVSIINKGAQLQCKNSWRGDYHHYEKCSITIEGNGEFYASDVVLRGSMHFHVPSGYKMHVTSDEKGAILQDLQKITKPSWHWKYVIGKDAEICIEKCPFNR